VVSPFHRLRRRVVDIPRFGSIPAGFAGDRLQEAKGCVSIDIETIGIRPTPRTFALEVRGDSMIGRHILDGDLVILEHGMTPRTGDVVAALIDNESTLKTFVLNRGKPYLRAENPRYPDLIPASELVIQGVMVALVRKGRMKMKKQANELVAIFVAISKAPAVTDFPFFFLNSSFFLPPWWATPSVIWMPTLSSLRWSRRQTRACAASRWPSAAKSAASLPPLPMRRESRCLYAHADVRRPPALSPARRAAG